MRIRPPKRQMTQKQGTVTLAVEDIVPDPDQPRRTFPSDGLSSLARSLVETGQVSPITVRPGPEGKYMIVVGERRWRAAKEAGLPHVHCIIRDGIDEQKAREMQLAENYQREDIPPLEQARSLKLYLDHYRVSQSELSWRTGIPQRSISNRLALLSLSSSLQARIQAGEIGPYEAVKIAALPADRQREVVEAVASGRMGGRQLEELIHARQLPQTSDKATQEAPQLNGTVEAIGNLSERLQNLEEAVYQLAATYAFNETARRMGEEDRHPPRCPECLRRGDKGWIWGIKRKMTTRDRWELIELMEENELSEEDVEELLGLEPTHVIEARCHQCGYKQFVGYA